LIYDMSGKLIDNLEVKPSEVSELKLGSNYQSGIYSVMVSQGNNVKIQRMIKK
jgi:hypothetical protein